MFEKLLAVVADERDQRAVGETQLLELLQDSPDLGVHILESTRRTSRGSTR